MVEKNLFWQSTSTIGEKELQNREATAINHFMLIRDLVFLYNFKLAQSAKKLLPPDSKVPRRL